MKVTKNDVLYVAGLANLALTPEEQVRMACDLTSILEYIDRLNALDTTNVPPMAQTSYGFGIDELKQGTERFAYAYREDIPYGLRPSLPHGEAMANAPETDGTFFSVPKVIERS
jgi:aspartyl-tRNA(Asn)/glutamyl-tRNA(Gln) amidotransferase subunit C